MLAPLAAAAWDVQLGERKPRLELRPSSMIVMKTAP